MTKEKKYVLGILSLVALGAVTLALTTFSTTPKPQPPVEYRAVCRNLPANAHRTSDGSTRKEIPQTETSPNVREPNPVGMFSEMNTDSNQCYFVCNT
ncbi:MAG: hypothetical protein LBG59_00765 [Candidatus Peribacteria bacterium]|jgi:hypothetical protein|nr:hypothetical protein [Candidatus Peribacteria bacterium]